MIELTIFEELRRHKKEYDEAKSENNLALMKVMEYILKELYFVLTLEWIETIDEIDWGQIDVNG